MQNCKADKYFNNYENNTPLLRYLQFCFKSSIMSFADTCSCLQNPSIYQYKNRTKSLNIVISVDRAIVNADF